MMDCFEFGVLRFMMYACMKSLLRHDSVALSRVQLEAVMSINFCVVYLGPFGHMNGHMAGTLDESDDQVLFFFPRSLASECESLSLLYLGQQCIYFGSRTIP